MIPIKDDNPTSTFPIMTILLIVINVLIFMYQSSLGTRLGQQFVIELGVIPHEITHFQNLPDSNQIPPLLTIFTSMFLHGGLMHLIGNMLYLWIFGNNIEDACGHFKFVFFYLICGLTSSIVHIISLPNSQTPTIGASGAIAGILGAYLLLYPKARILTIIPIFYFFRIIYLPAMLVLGLWFVIQLVNGFVLGGGGGVAWFAHIGGFVAGLVLINLFSKTQKRQEYYY